MRYFHGCITGLPVAFACRFSLLLFLPALLSCLFEWALDQTKAGNLLQYGPEFHLQTKPDQFSVRIGVHEISTDHELHS